MKYRLTRATLLVLIALLPTRSFAELVYFDNYVLDTNTNHEWLKFSLTYGAPLATEYTNAGWFIPDWQSSGPITGAGSLLQNLAALDQQTGAFLNQAKAQELADFMWEGAQIENPPQLLGVVAEGGFFNWEGATFVNGEHRLTAPTIGSYTVNDVLNCDDQIYSYCSQPYSWWVAREHAVPLPTTAWLFLSALSGLAFLKNRSRY